MKITGIYKITSPSNKIYIGQTVDFIKRKSHYKNLKIKSQIRLYNSINKYGWDRHVIEIIEKCSLGSLNERERYWQEFYNVLDSAKGLNCKYTVTNDKSGKHSEEMILNQRKGSKTKKEVFQYSLDGDFLHSYESITDAARNNNLYTAALHNSIVNNKTNTIGGFQWYYNYKGDKIPKISLGTITKKVRLYNETEEYIFNSRKECAKFINRSEGRVTDLIKIGTWKHYKIENYVTD